MAIQPGFSEAGVLATVRAMASTLEHRGPDDSGEWADSKVGLAFGFRRLAIIDLSPEGHQPMESASGRYVIVYNGEVYNHRVIRQELETAGLAPPWRGHSDTETILAATDAWGVRSAVQRFVGMFALALWDRQERQLFLVRDRMGIKPLYWGWSGNTLLFGSELKAIRAHPKFEGTLNTEALALYLRYLYVPAPHSIYKGISKLQPGALLKFDLSTVSQASADSGSDLRTRVSVSQEPYWSLSDIVEQGHGDPFTGSEDEAVEQLDALLREAVGIRMVADVPLGAFLSGGVDSSTVVALMQAQASRPVQTFSIGFKESDFNEADQASAVAKHLQTDHTELYASPEDAMAVIPRLPALYDEPYADSSQIPTFLVSQLARSRVTVSLSGDGGDELFAGYNRHFWSEGLLSRFQRIPGGVRRIAANAMTAISPTAWDRIYRAASPALPQSLRQVQPGDKIHRTARLMRVDGPEAAYEALVSAWEEPWRAIFRKEGAGVSGRPLSPIPRELNPGLKAQLTAAERMMFLDAVTYLPDDILTKVDRASMGVSLEARVPLLDHRVVEFAWRLPLSMKFRGRQGKRILRKVLYGYVPAELIERPKSGFAIPISSWLRGDLRPWAEELLSTDRLRREGLLNPSPIRSMWEEHLSGRRNWHNQLWAVLMFQSWLEYNRGIPPGSNESLLREDLSAASISGSLSRSTGARKER